jgi:hypothetical protein
MSHAAHWLAELSRPTATATQRQPFRPQAKCLRLLLPRVPGAVPEGVVEPRGSEKDETTVGELVVSPFTIKKDRLTVSAAPRYPRPPGGQVNGYVKFNWPSRNTLRRLSAPVPLPTGDGVEGITPKSVGSQIIGRSPSIRPVPAVSHVPDGTVSPMSIEGPLTGASSWKTMITPPVSPQVSSSQAVVKSDPKMLPPQFGFQAKMDNIDRRLFEFCMSALGTASTLRRRSMSSSSAC